MDEVLSFWMSQEPKIENMLLRQDAAEVDLLERPEVLSYLPNYKGFNVLDLGSGIGRFTGELAKFANRVTAVDLCQQFIKQNRQNNLRYENIDYLIKDI